MERERQQIPRVILIVSENFRAARLRHVHVNCPKWDVPTGESLAAFVSANTSRKTQIAYNNALGSKKVKECEVQGSIGCDECRTRH